MLEIIIQMTIEQLLVQCFYQNKKVGLQNIGNFELLKDIPLEVNNDKVAVIPEGSIQFNSNSKEPADESLVDYIKEHTKKMRSLASSDLESYTSLQKEMIYLGKSLLIPGIGTLHKSDSGNIEFNQGKGYEKITEQAPERKTSGMKEEVNFNAEKTTGNGKRGILIFAAILLSALSVAAVYYFINYKKDTVSVNEEQPEVTKTIATPTIATDSTQQSVTANLISTDSSTGKVIIKNYKTNAEAISAAAKFKSYGHNTSVIMKDSSSYLVAVSMYKPIADTTRLLDSLKKLFDYKTYIYQ